MIPWKIWMNITETLRRYRREPTGEGFVALQNLLEQYDVHTHAGNAQWAEWNEIMAETRQGFEAYQ